MIGEKRIKKEPDEQYPIFFNPSYFSMGTYHYNVDSIEKTVEYVPLYPDLYTHHDLIKNLSAPINVVCKRVYLGRNK